MPLKLQVIHTLAHLINFENFVYANDKTITYVNSTLNTSDSDQHRSLLLTLSQLSANNVYPLYLLGGTNSQYLNPVRVANSNTILEGLKLASGITGIIRFDKLFFTKFQSEYIFNYYRNYHVYCFGNIIFIINQTHPAIILQSILVFASNMCCNIFSRLCYPWHFRHSCNTD
jgi:hypothetical protein